MARGTIAQQAGQAAGVATLLVTATALARELTLSEFGVYGLVSGFAYYLYFAQGSAETALILRLSKALSPGEHQRELAVGISVYALLGLVAGALVAGGGWLALSLLLDGPLQDDAQVGAVGVGVGIVLGWPAKVAHSSLRAAQRFALASLAEALGHVTRALTLLALLLVAPAPLWLLIAVGSAFPLFVGLWSIAAALLAGISLRVRPSAIQWSGIRDLVRTSAALMGIAAADVFISQLDRVVLAAFRSPATLGLYEGAVRVNTLVRSFQSTFGVTILPVLSRLRSTGETARERDLLLRGTKYVLGAVVPPTIVLMILADRLLAVWFGPEFAAAGPATAIFLATWLFAPNVAFVSSLLLVEGELRLMARYTWSVAALNLALSLALTPVLGLEGVVIGTTAAYLTLQPFYLRFMLRRRSIRLSELATAAWLPVYGLGLLMAASLAIVRLITGLESPGSLAAAGFGALAGCWALLYAVGLDANDRRLVLSVTGLGRLGNARSTRS